MVCAALDRCFISGLSEKCGGGSTDNSSHGSTRPQLLYTSHSTRANGRQNFSGASFVPACNGMCARFTVGRKRPVSDQVRGIKPAVVAFTVGAKPVIGLYLDTPNEFLNSSILRAQWVTSVT
jgi:hypothetical protein